MFGAALLHSIAGGAAFAVAPGKRPAMVMAPAIPLAMTTGPANF